MTVNGVKTDYTYNNLDQLVSTSGPDGTATYTYDERGNLDQVTADSQTVDYTYNAADRLVMVNPTGTLRSGLSSVVQYTYDADGRRIKQTVGSQITNYLWDETSVYGDVVLETDGSGSTLASYVLGEAGLVSQNRNGATSYYLQDGQGSTRALTNAAGNVTDTYSYTAFGELFNQTGSTANSYLYTGQQFDALTGLYDLRARYYNPALGRFLSQDTYPYNFNNPVELNRYVYTANNPVNLVDPSGHQAMVGYGLSTLFKAIKNTAIIITVGVGIAVVISAVYRLIGTQELTWTWQRILALEERQSQFDPDENRNPTPYPPGWPDPRTPAPTPDQSTPIPDPEKPIVLDFGPGMNVDGEIMPLLNYYRPLGVKVVAIDVDPDKVAYLKLRLASEIPYNFDILEGTFNDPSILSRNGYQQCAIGAFALWPDGDGEASLPGAINNLVCPGGYVQSITEIKYRYENIAKWLQGSVSITSVQNPVSVACIGNPLMPKCADYRSATLGIGFISPYITNDPYNYVVVGTKR